MIYFSFVLMEANLMWESAIVFKVIQSQQHTAIM